VLNEQGSLLSPGRSIWTPPNLDDLSERVIGHPDFGQGSFTDKLVRQTRGASPAVMQLAGEALFVFHLKDAETPAKTKRGEIQRVLEGMSDPPVIPDDLAAALESRVARYGGASSTSGRTSPTCCGSQAAGWNSTATSGGSFGRTPGRSATSWTRSRSERAASSKTRSCTWSTRTSLSSSSPGATSARSSARSATL
jgi:hypothetical protein